MADDPEQFLLSLPAFAILMPEARGVVWLQHGDEKFLPLFTDRDSLDTYRERAGLMHCDSLELASLEAVKGFLALALGEDDPATVRVILDPLSIEPGGYFTAVTAAQILTGTEV